MKSEPKVIEALNELLAIELTAVAQYLVQARMCRRWGYHRLAQRLHQETQEEIKHAEALLDRILFLEGVPEVARQEAIRAGRNVKEQFENDLKLEITGVKAYNEAVGLCMGFKDSGSREILERILVESEAHVNWLESQLHVIEEAGLENYLAEQTNGQAG